MIARMADREVVFKIFSSAGIPGAQKRLYILSKKVIDKIMYGIINSGINPIKIVATGKNGYKYLS